MLEAAGKSFLIVNRRGPYGSSHAREALDIALMASVFNQKVSLLFMDDGVYQLLANQDTTGIEQKNLAQTLPMLEMYEVKDVYVEQSSLQARNLCMTDLIISAQALDSDGAGKLMASHDVVLGF